MSFDCKTLSDGRIAFAYRGTTSGKLYLRVWDPVQDTLTSEYTYTATGGVFPPKIASGPSGDFLVAFAHPQAMP